MSIERQFALAEENRKLRAEVERLKKLEGIAQGFVNTWNEFEQPMPLEWDMPDPMRTIHEWASDWKHQAEKAEAEVKRLREEIKPRYQSGYVDGAIDLDYQRRHRAIMHNWATHFRIRAEKVEVEFADYKKDCSTVHERDSLTIRTLEEEIKEREKRE